MIKTRFCPSPTGPLHLGNLRTALFSALFAKQGNGIFLLRIEDTDASKCNNQFTEQMQHDLHWLGIPWQEGPGVDGGHGPYWQSQRKDIYAKYYAELEKAKLAYPCFCTDDELLEQKKGQVSRGEPPRYTGKCRTLKVKEVAAKLTEGLKPTLRFKMPKNITIKYTDFVKGPYQFNSDDIGDFIIRRADGSGSFLYCNAIDDALMNVTHVLRGEDHLTNTPRQLLLLQSLQLREPSYGHMPLFFDENGGSLVKREGSSLNIQDLQKEGYLPNAIINYLARLGHTIANQYVLTLDELAREFDIEAIGHAAVRYDGQQLLYWQKQAVTSMDSQQFWHWAGEETEKKVPDGCREAYLECMNNWLIFPADAMKWANLLFGVGPHLGKEQLKALNQVSEQFFVAASNLLDRYGSNIKNLINELKHELNLSGSKLVTPLRVALTGDKDGPDLALIANLLGEDEIRKRFSRAFKAICDYDEYLT